jgi:hypothetical protein
MLLNNILDKHMEQEIFHTLKARDGVANQIQKKWVFHKKIIQIQHIIIQLNEFLDVTKQ